MKLSTPIPCACLLLATGLLGCSADSSARQEAAPEGAAVDVAPEDGSFLMYRRQSLIGEETFSVVRDGDDLVVRSLQGENERGRITGVQAELRLGPDLSPATYRTQRIAGADTTHILEVVASASSVVVREKQAEAVEHARPADFFPVHSDIPAAAEMMLYRYYLARDRESLPTFPRGDVRLTHRGTDSVEIDGSPTALERYVVEGINWGFRTIWLTESNDLVALVQANTQFREAIRSGYEEALPFFIAGHVEEQLRTLADYTAAHQQRVPGVTALVGGDVVDGVSDRTRPDMTVLVEDGRIRAIGPRADVEIPGGARVIDVAGKTLIPGLWDMHAHANQVQWAPAYLAGGVTTIRDLGNELEFVTAFRDAVESGAMGMDLLLAGMTDGAGITGNGVVRATTAEEAREVVELYHGHGYDQIKIYTAIEPDVLRVLTEEAHARGMSVTGHVPRAVENGIAAMELGMDQFNHRGLFLSVLFPAEPVGDLGNLYLWDREITPERVEAAAALLLEYGAVLDPTISLDIIRNLPRGTPLETVEPDVGRIAYELWEGKRFLSGVNEERAERMREDVRRGLEVLGAFHEAGVPIVAGTDNVVPVFNLYLEIES
ncbi:MAG: amidohydrolase family protein, partial [Gemmatimonadetes bacterium]|nr:amidohydrolase family protein [Gemmatimonadota bacterium]